MSEIGVVLENHGFMKVMMVRILILIYITVVEKTFNLACNLTLLRPSQIFFVKLDFLFVKLARNSVVLDYIRHKGKSRHILLGMVA